VFYPQLRTDQERNIQQEIRQFVLKYPWICAHPGTRRETVPSQIRREIGWTQPAWAAFWPALGWKRPAVDLRVDR